VQIAHTVEVDLDHQQAIDAVTAALSEQGFGVLTTIDIKATLAAKLGEQVDDYTILGACNPRLAHAALSASPEVGLLLPCNVTVRRVNGRTVVQAVDPGSLLAMAAGGGAELGDTAADAGRRLRAALDSLNNAAGPV
jgi:uncharacterized protein (DUF302 family)